MRIKKFKITSKNKIQVHYLKWNQIVGDWDEYTFSCSDEPRPELYAALNALSPHVREMCELPEDCSPRISVRGVSFSYGGPNEVMGATIMAQMELKRSYSMLNLNTPHKPSEPYSESVPADPKQLLSAELVQALNELCDEIELYINGQRAQQILHIGEIQSSIEGMQRTVDGVNNFPDEKSLEQIKEKEQLYAAIH